MIERPEGHVIAPTLDPRAPIAGRAIAVDFEKGLVQVRGRRDMAIHDDVVSIPIVALLELAASLTTLACNQVNPMALQLRAVMFTKT